jgi:hypothetical protein
MTAGQVQQAYDLLARRADLIRRGGIVATATDLGQIAAILSGIGVEDQILQRSRGDVADFIALAVSQVEASLTALGVTLDAPP